MKTVIVTGSCGLIGNEAWWAAFLSSNEDKRVLYPKVWLKGPGIETNFLVDGLRWECI